VARPHDNPPTGRPSSRPTETSPSGHELLRLCRLRMTYHRRPGTGQLSDSDLQTLSRAAGGPNRILAYCQRLLDASAAPSSAPRPTPTPDPTRAPRRGEPTGRPGQEIERPEREPTREPTG
jgi:hypothetical protein